MDRTVRNIIILLVVALPTGLLAQVGGNSVYDFMTLPSSARVTAVGGNLVVYDNDVSLAYHNPSLLNPRMHQQLVFGSNIRFAGIHTGYMGYGHYFDKLKMTWAASLQYQSYGNFTATDVTGAEQGNFSAGEMVVNIGAARQFDHYNVGANWKTIYSKFETYTSVGTAFDFAAAYVDTTKKWTVTVALKNVGFQYTPYHNNSREPMPLDLQIGFSKRLKYVPLLISVTMHNIQNWNLLYDDPAKRDEDNIFSNDTTSSSSGKSSGEKAGEFFDNLARHFNVGGELYLFKVFRLGFGYNHQRRQELKTVAKKGLAGLSFGVGFDIKGFGISFSRARFSSRAATNHISVSLDINRFRDRHSRKRQEKETKEL